jgi:medium-chain acyl-[acyl-carrier-protein] hydrolase
LEIVWEEKYKIRFHDTDMHGNCKIQEIFNFISETTWTHANHLGLGYEFMNPKGLIWAYARKRLEVVRYPKWGEEIIVRTWPRDYNRLYIHREFQVLDKNENNLINCSALYFAFNRKEAKAVAPDQLCAHRKDLVFCEKATSGKQSRIPQYDIDELSTYPYIVDFSDLDMHKHVNNLRYVDWIMLSLPTEFRINNVLKQIDVNYYAEANKGEGVHVNISQNLGNNTYRHSVVRNKDDKELFRAETQWVDLREVHANMDKHEVVFQ